MDEYIDIRDLHSGWTNRWALQHCLAEGVQYQLSILNNEMYMITYISIIDRFIDEDVYCAYNSPF